ncbi:MAG: hypothetical protein ACTSRH_13475 [Promethearchaeota archaeon]
MPSKTPHQKQTLIKGTYSVELFLIAIIITSVFGATQGIVKIVS